MDQNNRVIGITHRVKQIVRNGEVQEARPTLISISVDGRVTRTHELETETDELDFLLGRFPTSWSTVEATDDVNTFLSHHVKWKKMGKEVPEGYNPKHLKLDADGFYYIAHKVPSAYDGFSNGDVVVMCLGGSGDRLAYALSRRGDAIDAAVYRVPPYVLKHERDKRDSDKKEDHLLLASLFHERSELFQLCGARDRDLIRVTEAFRHRMEAQVERIGCEHRLRQRFIGSIFLSPTGQYPEGKIEDAYEAVAANDVILSALVSEEKRREAELRKIVQSLDVWQEIFAPIEGVGEMIAARFISAVGDIRRFESAPKFKAFAGVHVFGADGKKSPKGTDPSGGKFVRRRTGTVSDWNPTLRQALFLLGDQFNRRPNSVWGQKLREYKAKFRAKYPEPVVSHRDLIVSVTRIASYFERHGIFVSLSNFDFSSVDGVYEYHRACITSANEQGKDLDVQKVEMLLDELPSSVSNAGIVTKYTNGHIHKMATWRTLTKFAEWLWREWSRLEKRNNVEQAVVALKKAA